MTDRIRLQLIILTPMNPKFRNLIPITLQILEPKHRNPGRSGAIVKQVLQLVRIELSNTLPEPFDLLRLSSVALVYSIGLPIVNVNIRRTIDYRLQLMRLENLKQLHRNNLIKTFLQLIHILLHTFVRIVVDRLFYIFVLVRISQNDTSSIWTKLDHV